jgi:hypothetical protein
MVGCCEHSDEPSGFGTMELVTGRQMFSSGDVCQSKAQQVPSQWYL